MVVRFSISKCVVFSIIYFTLDTFHMCSQAFYSKSLALGFVLIQIIVKLIFKLQDYNIQIWWPCVGTLFYEAYWQWWKTWFGYMLYNFISIQTKWYLSSLKEWFLCNKDHLLLSWLLGIFWRHFPIQFKDNNSIKYFIFLLFYFFSLLSILFFSFLIWFDLRVQQDSVT